MSTQKKCYICPYHINHFKLDHENKLFTKYVTDNDCNLIKCESCQSANGEFRYLTQDKAIPYCLGCFEIKIPDNQMRALQQEDYEKWKKSRDAWEAQNKL